MEKIPTENSLNSFESVPEQNEAMNTQKEKKISKKPEIIDETPELIEKVRAELNHGEEKEDVDLNLCKTSLHNLKMFYQLFDSDKPDLTEEISAIKNQLTVIRALTNRIDNKENLRSLRDSLTELSGNIGFFLKVAEENKIGKKGWFSGGVMKNRDEVSSLNKMMFEKLLELNEKYNPES